MIGYFFSLLGFLIMMQINLAGITIGIRPIWGINSLTLYTVLSTKPVH